MKIAIFTDDFLPKIDGVATANFELAKGLADRGHSIIIICPKYNENNDFFYKNIKVVRIRGIPAFFYPDYIITSIFHKKIYSIIKKEKVDIIHVQTPLTLGLEGSIIAKLLHKPLVKTFHGMLAHPEYLKYVKMNNKFGEFFAWKLMKLFYENCDLLSCPSDSTKEELLKRKFKTKIKAISNGIDFSVFDNSKWKKVKNTYNKNGPIIFFLGRIAHEKNILFLFQSLKKVFQKVPSAKLLVVGDGPFMEKVKFQTKKDNIEKNVIFLGKIPHHELVKSGIFKACDFFVNPSVTETFGLTTLEAMVNGLPCVGVYASGTKDLIKDGYDGYLVNNGDNDLFSKNMIKLLEDKKLLKTMSKNAIKEAKKHSINKIIDVWEKEYLELISKSD